MRISKDLLFLNLFSGIFFTICSVNFLYAQQGKSMIEFDKFTQKQFTIDRDPLIVKQELIKQANEVKPFLPLVNSEQYDDEKTYIEYYIQIETNTFAANYIKTHRLEKVAYRINSPLAKEIAWNANLFKLGYRNYNNFKIQAIDPTTYATLYTTSGDTISIDLRKIRLTNLGTFYLPEINVGDILEFSTFYSFDTYCFYNCIPKLPAIPNSDVPIAQAFYRTITNNSLEFNFSFNKASSIKQYSIPDYQKPHNYSCTEIYIANQNSTNLKSLEKLTSIPFQFELSLCKGQLTFVSARDPKNYFTAFNAETHDSIVQKSIQSAISLMHYEFWSSKQTSIEASAFMRYCRNELVNRPIDEIMYKAQTWFRAAKMLEPDGLGSRNVKNHFKKINPEDMARYLQAIAEELGIEYQILFVPNKSLSSFREIRFNEDLELAFRYKNESNEWQYFYAFTSANNPGHFPAELANKPALGTIDGQRFELIQTPYQNSKQNEIKTSVNVQIDLEEMQANASTQHDISGSIQSEYAPLLLLLHNYKSEIGTYSGYPNLTNADLTYKPETNKFLTSYFWKEFDEIHYLPKSKGKISSKYAVEIAQSGALLKSPTSIKLNYIIPQAVSKNKKGYNVIFPVQFHPGFEIRDLFELDTTTSITLPAPYTHHTVVNFQEAPNHSFISYESLSTRTTNSVGNVQVEVEHKNGILTIDTKLEINQIKFETTSDLEFLKELLVPIYSLENIQLLLLSEEL